MGAKKNLCSDGEEISITELECRLLEELSRSEQRITNVNEMVYKLISVSETITQAYTGHIEKLARRIDRLHDEIQKMTDTYNKCQDIIHTQQLEITRLNERNEKLLDKVCAIHRETSVSIGSVNKE